MNMTTYEIRVTAKLGYFSWYKVPANDVHEAKSEAVKQFRSDFGCKDTDYEIQTYCINPHQKYADDHKGEPIVTVD